MACGMLSAIGDFLQTGIDEIMKVTEEGIDEVIKLRDGIDEIVEVQTGINEIMKLTEEDR
jgi:hypothetical protein